MDLVKESSLEAESSFWFSIKIHLFLRPVTMGGSELRTYNPVNSSFTILCEIYLGFWAWIYPAGQKPAKLSHVRVCQDGSVSDSAVAQEANTKQWRPEYQRLSEGVREPTGIVEEMRELGWHTASVTMCSLIFLLRIVVLKLATTPLPIIRDYKCLCMHLKVTRVLFQCYTTKMVLCIGVTCLLNEMNSVGYNQEETLLSSHHCP